MTALWPLHRFLSASIDWMSLAKARRHPKDLHHCYVQISWFMCNFETHKGNDARHVAWCKSLRQSINNIRLVSATTVKSCYNKHPEDRSSKRNGRKHCCRTQSRMKPLWIVVPNAWYTFAFQGMPMKRFRRLL